MIYFKLVSDRERWIDSFVLPDLSREKANKNTIIINLNNSKCFILDIKPKHCNPHSNINKT